jgi:multidrug efflux pump subunit AcrA (membrane-fusion protein)
VKVAIKDPAPELKPEMLARVRFVDRSAGEIAAGGTSEQVFAPAALFHRDGSSPRTTAWVVEKSTQTAALRPVTLGAARFGDWVAVASGLRPGDVLIAGDTSGLAQGRRVRIVGEVEDAEEGAPAEGGPRGAH